jgi:hypothetical protein
MNARTRRWTAGLVTVVMSMAALVALVRPGLAAFPGANGKLVFTSDRDGNAEIYAMNADGSGQTNLTANPASVPTRPGRRTGRRSPSPAGATATSRSTR